MTVAVETRPAHPVVSALADACAGMGDASDSMIYGLGDDQLATVIGECETLRALVHHLQLALIREAGERNLPRQLGAASTAAWLTGRYRLQPKDARRLVRIAAATGALAEPMDYAANVSARRTGRELVATAAALSAGMISPEHVVVVANVMDAVPSRIGIHASAQVEHEMAEFCREYDPGTVAKLGEALLEALTEDTLDDDEGERDRRRYLSLDETTGRIRGQLTREQLALVRTALDALAAPSPAEDGTPDQRTHGQRMADALGELARRAIAADMFENNHGMSHRVTVTIDLGALALEHHHEDTGADAATRDAGAGPRDAAAGAEDDGPDDEACTGAAAETGADSSGADSTGGMAGAGSAMSGREVRHGHPGDDDTAGAGRIPPAFARSGKDIHEQCSGLGAAGCAIPTGGSATPGELQWGSLISARAVRLIACHASIQRVVLDPAGAVLDVGREYRTVTPAQFAALTARDGGCAFPGCTRPASWCVAHHCRHWADGGATNLDNLVLLCGHHHRVVHYNGWQVRIDPTDRLPVFTPPRWMHADRVDWRNNRPRPSRPGPSRPRQSRRQQSRTGRGHAGPAPDTTRHVGEPAGP